MSLHRVPHYPTLNGKLARPLRGALFGGGLTQDGNLSFIGPHHRDAVEFRRRAQIVAGAFSDDSPDWSAGMAEFYQIDPRRAYRSADECLDAEIDGRLPSERIDFVDIATPNCAHFAVAKRAIEAGINVICEKPLTLTVQEAQELATLVAKHRVVFAIPHVYGYWPCSTLAREIVANEIGAESMVLNPIEGLTPDDVAQGRDYLSIMKDNLQNLRAALQCQ